MIKLTRHLFHVTTSLLTSQRRVSQAIPAGRRQGARCSRRREQALEVLDERLLLSPAHPTPSGVGSAEIALRETKRVPSAVSLPPLPVYMSLPPNQQKGKILSQTHMVLGRRVFLANQVFLAHTNLEYAERFVEAARPVGATSAGTAGDTSNAISTFFRELTNQVAAHGGSTTSFVTPLSEAGGGERTFSSSGVVENESYQAQGKRLNFSLTYKSPDDFHFVERFSLVAIRVAAPQPGSTFTLLDAVTQFEQHFAVSG